MFLQQPPLDILLQLEQPCSGSHTPPSPEVLPSTPLSTLDLIKGRTRSRTKHNIVGFSGVTTPLSPPERHLSAEAAAPVPYSG